MSNETFKVNGSLFEDRYVKWEELGLPSPQITPKQLWAWGTGTDGRLGLGTNVNRSSPIQVGSLVNWSSVFAGSRHSLSIKSDGTLWSWGDNSDISGNGALGLGDIINRSSPVQVGALTDWKNISAGDFHSLSVKTNGTLWGWGGEFSGIGVLGLNGVGPSRSSPTQIGSLTSWNSVAAGSNHSFAITTAGALWGWGSNGAGRLGLNDVLNRSSPVRVGTLSDWLSVSASAATSFGHTVAVKTTGTLWSWGAGLSGQLGLSSTVSRSSPTQIGSVTTWSAVSVGRDHTLALRSAGTLWSWGVGSDGRLGLGTVLNVSAPSQLGTLTTWKQVSAGDTISLALKTDGTLWSWGGGTGGNLGNNNIISVSSPVQVGSLTTWRSFAAGKDGNHSLAVKFS
jgi:alpha-tubulin suppressor-like RCC1 family protein